MAQQGKRRTAKKRGAQDIGLLFGERLRAIRKARGLSQEGLAALVGKDHTFIGALERGEQSPRLETLAQIAQALDMSVADLLSFPSTAAPFSYPEAAHQKIYGILRDKDADFQDKVVRMIEILSRD